MLLVFACVVQFLMWNQSHKTSLRDLFYSFLVGVLVQSAISLFIFQTQQQQQQPFVSSTISAPLTAPPPCDKDEVFKGATTTTGTPSFQESAMANEKTQCPKSTGSEA